MCPHSTRLNLAAGELFATEVSTASCSADVSSSFHAPPAISDDSVSEFVESHFSCENSASVLSEDSLAQSFHSRHELVKDGSFDNGTRPVLPTALQTMKRADSLPSSLLRYVSVPKFVLKMHL